MKILNDAIIKGRYEVIVIGSGLGGLTAASLLAKRGLEVLLIEHHYLPGGMCTTFRRNGFSFDTGTALLYGFGEKGLNPHRFVINQLEEDLEVIEHQALLRMWFEDKKITFWPDYDRFIEEITGAFPEQKDELCALYAYLFQLYTNIIARRPMVVPPSEMPLKENLLALLTHPVDLFKTVRMLSVNTESVLTRFIHDPLLLAFFDKLTSTYCYCTVKETPAILAASMFIDNHIGGAYYPARSPQILSSTLEKAFEKFGGQSFYRHRVDEIIIEKGHAQGVRLADGTVIRADRIVANVTVWNLYGKLIKPEFIKPKRLAWAQKLIPTYPSMVLYLGVDALAIPAGTNPVEMLIADKTGVNSGDITLYISSLDDPSIAPPGLHAITVIAPSMIAWPRPWEEAYQSNAYRKQKEVETERIIDQIEGRFPGMRKYIRLKVVGTPSTIERYTLKNGGAVGGPKECIGQELLQRLHARSEWKNLYLCGDSTVMGMGTPAVTVSGVGATNCVLRDLGLPEYRPRKFDRQYVHRTRGAPLPPLPKPQEPITPQTAKRLARECQYCEHPGCTLACPAAIDIANVMRRIEAGNFTGAARALRETNPLAEICAYTCRPNPPCEKRCNRRAFSPWPVRIADLQSWVCAHTGEAGRTVQKIEKNGVKIAIVGAGPAGITASHFLGRLGYTVDLYDRRTSPGGSLTGIRSTTLPREVIERELATVLNIGVILKPNSTLGENILLDDLTGRYAAVLLATGENSQTPPARALRTKNRIDQRSIKIQMKPGLFVTGSLSRGRSSLVQTVADARRAAQAIDRYIQET